MKNLQNLKGAQLLSKQEQQMINGGSLCIDECYNYPVPCPEGSICIHYTCHSGGIVGMCFFSQEQE